MMNMESQIEPEVDPRELDVCTFCYPSPTYGTTPPILYEDERVYVTIALGQFTRGYLLLITKDHIDCYGDAATEEIAAVKSWLREILEDQYGSACFYEHGRTGSCMTRGNNRICYHAHLHCLPVPTDFTDRIAADFERREIGQWTDVVEQSDRDPHYLYLETDDGRKSFFAADASIERQYLRKRACEALSVDPELADWSENPLYDQVYETFADLRDRMAREHPDV